MRQFLGAAVVLPVLFSLVLCLDVEASQPNIRDIETVVELLVSNKTDITPPALVENPIPPNLVDLREQIFKTLNDDNFKGYLAYLYLYSLLDSGPDAIPQLKDRILKKFLFYKMKLSDARFIYKWLSSGQKPISSASKIPDTSLTSNGIAAGANIETLIQSVSSFFGEKGKLQEALKLTEQMVGFDYNPQDSFAVYVTGLFKNDQKFLVDTARFYGRLMEVERWHPHRGDFTFTDSARVLNIWSFPVSASGGDRFEAMRTLMVFAYEQCCNGLPTDGDFSPFIDLLNKISPTAKHDDSPESVLHAAGALWGVDVSKPFKDRFSALSERTGKKYFVKYHNVYGGMFIASELLRHGFGNVSGYKFSTFAAEVFGHFQEKSKITDSLSVDAKYLWQIEMDEDEKTTPSKPKSWTDQRFQSAKNNLDEALAYLDYVTEQYRIGAEFAFKIYLDN